MEKTLKELYDECEKAGMKMVDIVLREHSTPEFEEANEEYQLAYAAFCKKCKSISNMKG